MERARRELSIRLGIPVVSMVARAGEGLEDLKDAVVAIAAWGGAT